MRLGVEFFARSADVVAREMLGKRIVYAGNSTAIAATEAYFSDGDGASHLQQVRKMKRASEAFSRGPGTIYIHFNHGGRCMDLIAGNGSVLLCAVALPAGNGPHKALAALGIGKEFHTVRMTDADSPIWLEEGSSGGSRCVVSPRRRVKAAFELPLRFEAAND